MARLPEEEIQRRFLEALKVCRISDAQALDRWGDLDEQKREERRRRSEEIRARHMVIVDDETGQRLVGGPQPKKDANDVKQEIAQTITDLADGPRQKEVVDALFSGLEDESNAVRGKAAERIIKISQEQREKERRDRGELRSLGKDELIARLVQGILAGGLDKDMLTRMREAPPFDAETTGTDVVDAAPQLGQGV